MATTPVRRRGARTRRGMSLLAPPTLEHVWAALHVWSAVGDGYALLRGAQLASGFLEAKKRRDMLRCALERAAERLVRRRSDAFAALCEGYATIDPRLRLSLLAGVGASGDARGAELLAHVLDTDEEHAPAALAQAQRIGASSDPMAHRWLCDELRERLESDSASMRIAAVRALGAQRDWRSIERMLELLEEDDENQRTSVLWALRRATKLEWRGLDSWRAWHTAESRWREERLEHVLDQLASNAPKQVLAALAEAAAHPLFAERTAPWAVDALASTNTLLRISAADALARLDSPLAYPALVEALDDFDTDVAQAAHRSLMRLSGLALDASAPAWRAALLP